MGAGQYLCPAGALQHLQQALRDRLAAAELSHRENGAVPLEVDGAISAFVVVDGGVRPIDGALNLRGPELGEFSRRLDDQVDPAFELALQVGYVDPVGHSIGIADPLDIAAFDQFL